MGILDKLFGSSGNSEEDRIALFVNLLTSLSAADGNISDEEGKYVSNYIYKNVENISKEKWDRILAKSESLGTNAMQMASKLDRHDKVELVKDLIGLAASDGHFHGAELGWILAFSVTIGLDPKKIQKEIEGSHEIDWNEATESMKNFAKELEDKTGVKIDGVDHLNSDIDNIYFGSAKIEIFESNHEILKFYNSFWSILKNMIDILGNDVIKTFETFGCGEYFPTKNIEGVFDEVGLNELETQNLPEEIYNESNKNQLELANILFKHWSLIFNLCQLVARPLKLELSKLVQDIIENRDNDKKVKSKWINDLSEGTKKTLDIISHHCNCYSNNRTSDAEFKEGKFDSGLAFALRAIFNRLLPIKANSENFLPLKDDIANFLFTFGCGLALKQEFKAAIIIFNKSIELSPDNNNIAQHLTNRGRALAGLGLFQGAKLDYKKALEKDENFEVAKKLISTTNELIKLKNSLKQWENSKK